MALTPRTSAIFAAIAYVAMSIIAPLSLFDLASVPPPRPDGADDLRWSVGVGLGILKLVIGLGTVIALDIMIAGALYHLFRSDSPLLALGMMVARIVYALLFAFALVYAGRAFGVVQNPPVDSAHIEKIAGLLDQFQRGWDFAFFFFGIHLVLLAALVWDQSLWRRALAVLIVIAGAGYFADSLIIFTLPNIDFRFSPSTFVGELALIVWLFAAAGRPEPEDT